MILLLIAKIIGVWLAFATLICLFFKSANRNSYIHPIEEMAINGEFNNNQN